MTFGFDDDAAAACKSVLPPSVLPHLRFLVLNVEWCTILRKVVLTKCQSSTKHRVLDRSEYLMEYQSPKEPKDKTKAAWWDNWAVWPPPLCFYRVMVALNITKSSRDRQPVSAKTDCWDDVIISSLVLTRGCRVDGYVRRGLVGGGGRGVKGGRRVAGGHPVGVPVSSTNHLNVENECDCVGIPIQQCPKLENSMCAPLMV